MKTSILGDFHASKENVSPNFLQEFETKPPVQQVSPVSAEKKIHNIWFLKIKLWSIAI